MGDIYAENKRSVFISVVYIVLYGYSIYIIPWNQIALNEYRIYSNKRRGGY